MELTDNDVCIRCGGRMVHLGFKIYWCLQYGLGMKKSRKIWCRIGS